MSENMKHDEYDVVAGKAGYNISWRAVFAGVVTFLAVSILFSLIGSAIGLGTSNLTSSQPFQGVGTGVIIWTIVALIISLALAGFVAGLTANRTGFVHGFLTWATSVIILFALVASAAFGAVNMLGNVLGSVGQTAGTVIEEAGSSIASLTEDAFNSMTENMNIDTSQLEGNVSEVLQDTEVEELQPEYLQSQLDAVASDVTDAGYAIVVEGQDPQQVISDLGTTIEERASNITQEIDRDALTEAVSSNSDLSEQEVQEAVDNIEQSYNEASQQTTQLINEAQTSLDQFGQQVDQTIQDARQTAENVANQTAQISLWLFLGLLLALVITSVAGHFGSVTTLPFNRD